jgi:hypothetical protein
MFDQFLPSQNGASIEQLPLALILLGIWTVIWKVIGLWRSAKKGQKWWFLAIFFINTAGLLELIYLGFFEKGERNIIEKWKAKKTSKKK